jgi:hypothetical protein
MLAKVPQGDARAEFQAHIERQIRMLIVAEEPLTVLERNKIQWRVLQAAFGILAPLTLAPLSGIAISPILLLIAVFGGGILVSTGLMSIADVQRQVARRRMEKELQIEQVTAFKGTKSKKSRSRVDAAHALCRHVLVQVAPAQDPGSLVNGRGLCVRRPGR